MHTSSASGRCDWESPQPPNHTLKAKTRNEFTRVLHLDFKARPELVLKVLSYHLNNILIVFMMHRLELPQQQIYFILFIRPLNASSPVHHRHPQLLGKTE